MSSATTPPHPSAPACRLLSAPCVWSHHGYKHFPYRGLRREHTQHGPARYLMALSRDAIEQVERATASAPDRRSGLWPDKTRYVRFLDHVVGWDEGRDATVSYVECGGGSASRWFHGRPMHGANVALGTLA